jgi:hypothetical protein
MADKNSFTRDEWRLILESSMIAGIAITAAEPSGLWGTLKESLAGGSALAKATMESGANTRVKAVAGDFVASEDRSAARDGLQAKLTGSSPAAMKAKCIDALQQVSALLDAKAPADASAFKDWLRQISMHTAEAASEGAEYLASAASRSVMRRRRRFLKFPLRSGWCTAR